MKTILRYSKDSGLFYEARSNTIRHGHEVTPGGYRAFKIKGKIYLAHRLAWFLVTGRWPTSIDHKNGKKWDNRWRNLRLATTSQNQSNRGKPKRGKLPKGVWLSPKRTSLNKYGARLIKDKKTIYLGWFSSPQKAHAAYKMASKKYHGEYSWYR